MTVDAGEHLRLIHRVIYQMGLRGDLAEEAFSEGLVHITVGAQSYNPEKGVSVASWLAQNIRWGLYKWLDKQRPAYNVDDIPLQTREESFSKVIEYREVLGRLAKLTELQRTVVLAEAFGFKGVEVARRLGVSPVSISKAKHRAMEKLNATV